MKNFFLSPKEFRIEPSLPPLYYGSFYIGPFENGQALTVANALRRTLLSEIPGLGITSVKIEGISHEYANMVGMKENVLDLLLNFKDVVLKKTTNTTLKQVQIGYLQVRGPGVVRSGDLKLPPMIQCVDPDQYLCTLNEKGSLNIVFTIEEGKNFLFRKTKTDFSNLTKKSGEVYLPIEAIFSPIKRVNYTIQSYSTETVYKSNQFVIVEIWTNGSTSPQDALMQTLAFLRFVFAELGKLEVLTSISNGYQMAENPQIRQAFRDLNRDLDFLEYSSYKKKLFFDSQLSNPGKFFTLPDQKLNQLPQKTLEHNSSITELGLSFPMFKAFYKAKIFKIGEMLKLTKKELQAILKSEDPLFTEFLQTLKNQGLKFENFEI